MNTYFSKCIYVHTVYIYMFLILFLSYMFSHLTFTMMGINAESTGFTWPSFSAEAVPCQQSLKDLLPSHPILS